MTQKEDLAFRPKLVAVMQGALMYRVQRPAGIPEVESDATRQIRSLESNPVFAKIASLNREVLIDSLVRTVRRVEYHYRRFLLCKESIEQVRSWAPGEVFWDETVSCMHFELQAQCGAAKMFLDELVYLIAIRHNPNLSKNQARKWDVAKIFDEPVEPGSTTDVSEIHRIKSHINWFKLLNAYRNMFFHNGWYHGSGHFEDDGRKAARLPRMNALLVPDQGSLRSRSKPYEWTWKDGTTVDKVAREVYEGLLTVVHDICESEWDAGIPEPGTFPEDEYPNLMVTLIKPVVFVTGRTLVVPFFTSRSKGERVATTMAVFSQFVHNTNIELVELRSSPHVAGTEALNFSLHGLEPEHGTELLRVYLDPVPADDEWRNVSAVWSNELALSELLKNKMKTVSVPVSEPITAYVWRTPMIVS